MEDNQVKAIILAAGKGTRLKELTKDTPKPMIEVAGKPVCEHVMRRVQRAGIDDFVLVTKYLSHKVRDYFGDGSRFGMHVEYVEQGDDYGTGAAFLCARELAGGKPTLMTFSDVVMSTCNYDGALSVYMDRRGGGVITVNPIPDPCKGADVELNVEHTVARINEKPPAGTKTEYLNSSGLFVFDPILFDYLEKVEPSPRGEYEMPDAMNAMAADGIQIFAYYLQGYWKDVGTIEDLKIATELIEGEELSDGCCSA